MKSFLPEIVLDVSIDNRYVMYFITETFQCKTQFDGPKIRGSMRVCGEEKTTNCEYILWEFSEMEELEITNYKNRRRQKKTGGIFKTLNRKGRKQFASTRLRMINSLNFGSVRRSNCRKITGEYVTEK